MSSWYAWTINDLPRGYLRFFFSQDHRHSLSTAIWSRARRSLGVCLSANLWFIRVLSIGISDCPPAHFSFDWVDGRTCCQLGSCASYTVPSPCRWGLQSVNTFTVYLHFWNIKHHKPHIIRLDLDADYVEEKYLRYTSLVYIAVISESAFYSF